MISDQPELAACVGLDWADERHAGSELEQIQFLLGAVSVQTTERYLGCKQKRRHAVNDRLGLDGG